MSGPLVRDLKCRQRTQTQADARNTTNPAILSVPPPAEPRGEKKLFFVQILGGEKLLKFGEKWAVKHF